MSFKTNPSKCTLSKWTKDGQPECLKARMLTYPFGTWTPEVSCSHLKTLHLEEWLQHVQTSLYKFSVRNLATEIEQPGLQCEVAAKVPVVLEAIRGSLMNLHCFFGIARERPMGVFLLLLQSLLLTAVQCRHILSHVPCFVSYLSA